MTNRTWGLVLIGAAAALVAGQVSAQKKPAAAPPAPAPATAAAYGHAASAANISHNSTYLEHTGLNGNPNAIPFVTPVLSPASRFVGVWYDTGRGRWAVFNEDRSPMAVNQSFHVVAAAPSGLQPVIHTASAANISNNSTYIDHPAANGQPSAVVFATQRWNQSGANGGYNPRAVGVWYDAARSRWAIYNEDQSAMGVGLQFDVIAASIANSAGAPASFVWRTSPGKAAMLKTMGDSNDILLVTHSYQSSGPYLNAYYAIGLEPDSGQWNVSGNPAANTIFNVLTFRN